MGAEETIKQSYWWREAQEMPDRHFDPSEGVSLSDHLEAVYRNLGLLSPGADHHDYFHQLNQALMNAALDPDEIKAILEPVALLHDIGKTREDKSAEGLHPTTGKSVRMRHPVVGVAAALDLLPEGYPERDTILALVDEHDTPFFWFMQFQKSGQIPKRKSWAKLDRKIDSREDGAGLVLLAVFKLADIGGHEEVDDAVWFFEQAFENYLREKGKWLPVPDKEAITSL